MQNAKDTFYAVLRDRLALVNPDRTVVVRGVTRPAVVVNENETTNVARLTDCFHLQWTAEQVTQCGVLPLVTLRCGVSYSTAGNSWNGGLDRGRVLAAMDAELLAIVGQSPQRAPKVTYTAGATSGVAVPMATSLWWSDLVLEAAKTEGETLQRTAFIEVMSFEEMGEK